MPPYQDRYRDAPPRRKPRRDAMYGDEAGPSVAPTTGVTSTEDREFGEPTSVGSSGQSSNLSGPAAGGGPNYRRDSERDQYTGPSPNGPEEQRTPAPAGNQMDSTRAAIMAMPPGPQRDAALRALEAQSQAQAAQTLLKKTGQVSASGNPYRDAPDDPADRAAEARMAELQRAANPSGGGQTFGSGAAGASQYVPPAPGSLRDRAFGRPGEDQYTAAARSATNAAAGEAEDQFKRVVGERLGQMNALGALRSGGTTTAVRDAGKDYATAVTRAAAGNAAEFARLQNERDAAHSAGVFRASESAADRALRSRELDIRERQGDREFSEGTRRFDLTRGDQTSQFDREFGEGTRRFDLTRADERDRYDREFGYRSSRDARADMESDRAFGRQTSRDTRADYESDREFTFRGERYVREDFESDRDFEEAKRLADRDYAEQKRQFDLERADAREAAKQARKASRWGVFGRVAGAAGNAVGGWIGRANSGQ